MEVISSGKRIVRKEHICDYCGKVIHKKEEYEYFFMKGDDIYTWKNHISCHELASKMGMFKDTGDEGVGNDYFYEVIYEKYCNIKDIHWENAPEWEEVLNFVKEYYKIEK
jgi:hypothetical protein